jgi:cytochrome P450
MGGQDLSTAPLIDIDVAAFWNDPYPTLAALRKETPIAYVPQLGSTLLCARNDISVSEKQIDVFSSDQPNGLMTRLMGYNMMRKDGAAHSVERNAFFPAVSPRAVKTHWSLQFQAHADRLIDTLASSVTGDFIADFALPFSAECLKSVTGLTNMRYQDMNAWSQAMIDGIANYGGDPAVEARCHEATAGIDAAIDDMLPGLGEDNKSLLGVMVASGMPMDSVRANIKLAISGGQTSREKRLPGHCGPCSRIPSSSNSFEPERCPICRRSRNSRAGFRRSACRPDGSQGRGPFALSISRGMTGYS